VTEISEVPPAPDPIDPFDPAALRVNPDFVAMAGVKRLLTMVPVRKPRKQEFIRVHPSEDYRLTTRVIDVDEDRETYLVAPALCDDISDEIITVTLYATITQQNAVFLWPCKMPAPDGRKNQWHESAVTAAEQAMKGWVKVVADMGMGGYAVFGATGTIPDPEWPEADFHTLLKLAFADRFIATYDHPVLRRLRGA
jgi:hypothetical protein